MGILKQYYLEQEEKERELEVRAWFKDRYGHEPNDFELAMAWADFEQDEAMWWAMSKED